MEDNALHEIKGQRPNKLEPNATRPVWVDGKMACDSCHYHDQDIDTFPCAKCHTRLQ